MSTPVVIDSAKDCCGTFGLPESVDFIIYLFALSQWGLGYLHFGLGEQWLDVDMARQQPARFQQHARIINVAVDATGNIGILDFDRQIAAIERACAVKPSGCTRALHTRKS